MYDHEPEDVNVLGWDEFMARQWESIFAGYRGAAGLRKMCRRWSDLIEIGLGPFTSEQVLTQAFA